MKSIRYLTCVALSAVVLPSELGSVAVAQTPAAIDRANSAPNSINSADSAGESAEEQKERAAAERFLELLKKRPRVGTALDRVYGFHVERGSLDSFCDSLRTQAQQDSKGDLWMLLGIVLVQRGQDGEAIGALERASELLPKEPLARFYLGKTLLLVGETDRAAAMMRQAIELQPAKPDALQIFQELGRIYQRSRRMDEARQVWQRLETMFPSDLQVLEQIASILSEEGATEEALLRFQKLAQATTDRYRQVELATKAAQLKVQLGQRSEALTDFEGLLAKVNPDSWLQQDIRDKIDNSFLAGGDYDGLVKYYNQWTERHPEDASAMIRIGRLLSIQRRLAEARAWFAKAIQRSPSDPAPRMALVEACERDQDYTAAAQAMADLVALEPNNLDYLVTYGELVFNDRSLSEGERSNRASEIWQRMLDRRGEDPVTTIRVADLLRGAAKSDQAIALYRKAIELAKNEPQYREYLGEYLHELGRKEEALDTWRSLAAGERENRDNLVRLSEVLSTFKYDEEALQTIERACHLRPTFGHLMRYCELLREASKNAEALSHLDAADKLAVGSEELDLVIKEQIENYEASGQLQERIAQLELATAGSDKSNPASWRRYALLLEADRKYQQASLAIGEAAKLDGRSQAIWTTAARVRERAGDYAAALASLRKLATLDRRYTTNYLLQIASLQMRLGSIDEALSTAEELISASAGNSEHFRFYADLCMQAGKTDRALSALRRNARSNSNDRNALTQLAKLLADQFQSDEAIDLYWRAFERAANLEEKRADVESLTELYLRTNRFAKLLERLDTLGREQNRQREFVLLSAAALQFSGDFGAARQRLEHVLREDSRDTQLLESLVKLSQAEHDYEAAADYQQRLNAVSPSPEGEFLLAKFLLETGETSAAQNLWMQLSQRRQSRLNVAETVYGLLAKSEFEAAADFSRRALEHNSDDWELMAAATIAYWLADDRPAAGKLAENIWALKISYDEPTQKTKDARSRSASKPSNPTSPNSFGTLSATMNAAQGMAASNSSITDRQAWLQRGARLAPLFASQSSGDPFGSGALYGGYGSSIGYSSMFSGGSIQPVTFGDARSVALAAKLALEQTKPAGERQFSDRLLLLAKSSSIPDELWDALMLLQLGQRGNPFSGASNSAVPVDGQLLLKKLVELGDGQACHQLLTQFYAKRTLGMRRPNGQIEPNSEALSPLDLDDALALLEQWVARGGRPLYYHCTWLASELHRANRLDESKRVLDRFLDRSQAPREIAFVANSLLENNQIDDALKTLARALEINKSSGKSPSPASGLPESIASFLQKLCAHPDARPEQVWNTLLEVMDRQAERVKGLRPSELASYVVNQPVQATYVTNSNVVTRIAVDFPGTSGLLSAELLIALRVVLQQPDFELADAIEEKLAGAAGEVSQDNSRSAVRRASYATWLWWRGERDLAISALRSAKQLALATDALALMESRMLYDSQRYSEALEVLDALRPINQQMLQDRELAVLQLVLQKGDLQRAKQSAERLFALRLDADTQTRLAQLMLQLGMKELGDSMLSRTQRRTGNQIQAQMQIMQQYQSQNKTEAAAEIARQIVRRTRPADSPNRRTPEDSARQTALRVLVQSGSLNEMIAQLEKRLDASPKSSTLIRQLAEFYTVVGQVDKSREVLSRLPTAVRKDASSMMASAQSLMQSNQHSAAVDAFLAAIEQQPDLLANGTLMFRQSFDATKRWPELVNTIETVGVGKFGRSLAQLGPILMYISRSGDSQSSARLLEVTLRDTGLSGLSQMLLLSPIMGIEMGRSGSQRAYDPDFVNMLADRLIDEIKSGQFALSFQNSSISLIGNGRAITPVTSIVRIVAGQSALLQRVISESELALEREPANYRLRLLLAHCHAANRDWDKVRSAVLPAIAASQAGTLNLERDIWGLCSQLAFEFNQHQLAIDLLLPTIDRLKSMASPNRLDTQPQGLLFACYRSLKKFELAKELLDAETANANIDQRSTPSIPGYGEYQLLQNRLTLAAKYLEIDAPLEAYLLAREASDDKEAMLRSRQFSSSLDAQLQQTLDRARRALQPATIATIISRAMLPEQGQGFKAWTLLKLDFKPGQQTIDNVACPLQELAALALGDTSAKQVLSDAVRDARQTNLETMPVASLAALAIIADSLGDPPSVLAAANELEKRFSSSGAEARAIRKPSSKSMEQRGAERLALWLVGQAVAKIDGNRRLAAQLAELSLDGATQGIKPKLAIAMKMKIADLFSEIGDKAQTEHSLRSVLNQILP